jgi:hypothetical protein
MAMDFPNSPVVGQTFSSGSRIWVWTGTTWDSPAAGTPGIVSSTGGTFTGDITAPNYAGLGNAIINGAFDFWQRGTSFTNPSNGYNIADRFYKANGGSGATRVFSRETFTPGSAPVAGVEGQFFLKVNQSVAGTGDTFNQIGQSIEDVRTFAGQTVTFSFYAKAQAATGIQVRLEQNFGSGGSPTVSASTTIITLTTNWTRYSATVSVPSISGKTLGPNSFLNLAFYFPNNETFNIDFWGVQLEAGSVATPFKRNANSLQGELAACQRYYERVGTGTVGRIGGGDAVEYGVRFTQKRAAPTISLSITNPQFYDPAVGTKTATASVLSTPVGPSVNGAVVALNGYSGLVTGNFAIIINANYLEISSEL